MKEIRFRCWINVDEEKFFGPGPLQLLQLIEELGSLSKAAKTMGMSYKKAWDIVNTLNSKASEPIVLSQKGGAKGGGAEITEKGRQIMKSYSELNKKIETLLSEEKHILDLL
ncbi:winged helix-turn-helix domain-containing protein [Fulvivirga sediminis]|uniref:LysR family transcriptional regulator n=1 Tax=Fulvivirga sediminis TaxID=2803949 RepID=A0A937K0I1_9BACT|nr:LysR family transcriptional regulator [Fulvivirga sediminis]MBL3657669.1 LysR family transcriptional regulator [Fulvivirga sediminis]